MPNEGYISGIQLSLKACLRFPAAPPPDIFPINAMVNKTCAKFSVVQTKCIENFQSMMLNQGLELKLRPSISGQHSSF